MQRIPKYLPNFYQESKFCFSLPILLMLQWGLELKRHFFVKALHIYPLENLTLCNNSNVYSITQHLTVINWLWWVFYVCCHTSLNCHYSTKWWVLSSPFTHGKTEAQRVYKVDVGFKLRSLSPVLSCLYSMWTFSWRWMKTLRMSRLSSLGVIF